MAAGTQGRNPRGGKWPLAPREGFPAAGNGRWHPGKDSPPRGNGREEKNGVSELFRDAVFAIFYTEAFVLTPFHFFTPSLLHSFTPSP